MHNINILLITCFNSPGYFTAPVSGKYFFSGILTGHKNIKIEAVLSKSNVGVTRVDSAGYQPEGLEKPIAEAKHTPGALAVFNIILPLEAGDAVCIDLVTGKLAHYSEPLTIFSGMLLYETVWLDVVSLWPLSLGETFSPQTFIFSAELLRDRAFDWGVKETERTRLDLFRKNIYTVYFVLWYNMPCVSQL